MAQGKLITPLTADEEQRTAKISQQQFNVLMKMQEAAERTVRKMLIDLGVHLTDDMGMDLVYEYMRRECVEVTHFRFLDKSAMNGWYFKKHGKFVACIYDPRLRTGR